FYYENVSGASGTYKYLDHLIVLDNANVLDADDEYPEGTYTNTSGIDSFLLKKVTAQVTMYVVDENENRISTAINGKVPQGSKVQFQITSTYPREVGLKFTNPKGTVNGTSYLGTSDLSAESFGKNRVKTITLDDNLTEGTWTVWAYFKTNDVAGYMVPYAPYDYQNGKTYTFTIVPSSVSMNVDATEATVGNYIQVTVAGKAGDKYQLKPNEKYTIVPGQEHIDGYTVTIGKDGTTRFSIHAVKDGTFTLQLCSGSTVEEDAELTFTKAKISVNAEDNSYTIGNDIKLYGTNEKGDDLYYYIEGINQPFVQIPAASLKKDRTGETWETTVKGTYISTLQLDTATYTFYVSTVNSSIKDNALNKSGSSASASINLVQPTISLTSCPDVIVQGNDLTIKGTAEGKPETVSWYLFGTNKFYNGTTDVGKSGSFIIEKTLDKDDFAAGQYYLIVQHPMYDKVYNIGAIKSGNEYLIVQNKSGSFDIGSNTVLFNVNDRQSANAAFALCDAINSEDIDDIAVKRSFIVAASETTVDPIPSQITKGLPFTVSGTSNDENGETITVELLSTAFSASSKYQATSASFVSLIATPDENGKWAVTFNTSGLNVDTYTINVYKGTAQATTARIDIVEPSAVTATTTATPMPTVSATAKPTESAQSPVPLLGVVAGLIAVILCRKRE
ncbi:MAG TPA: hypothetical protein O0X50_02550, partial [Methanocorpusculum sp.]|nr:hypothetical protein [Methanocorpusculum sp.]